LTMDEAARERVPRVSIGMPVYNGAEFLAETLDHLLAQRFADFELIISDNGSTDGTEAMCRAWAGRDPRIRYVRHEVNRGSMFNHNFVLDRARGEYFRWASHDDLVAPEYLERCVEVMERDSVVVLCHTRILLIDGDGNVTGRSGGSPGIGSPHPHERFREFIGLGHRFLQSPMCFGVVRTPLLKSLGGFGAYLGSDRVLLAELSLHGRVVELPEELFSYRQHEGQLSKTPSRFRGLHYDPSNSGVRFPTFRLGAEYLLATWRAPLTGAERRRCDAELVRWPFHYWKHLGVDVYHAGQQVTALLAQRLRLRRPAQEHYDDVLPAAVDSLERK
jgi:glycosyltransferase involved in cell wall biosynthesis